MNYELQENPQALLHILASLLESYRPAWTPRTSNKNLLIVPQLSLALSVKAFRVSATILCGTLRDSTH